MLRTATLLAILSCGSTARAQPTGDDTAAARALFDEGSRFVEAEQWADAADRFRRALALRPSPAIRYNLAAAVAKLGSLVEASELCREVLRETAPADAARAPAETLLAEIEPRIGRLTIRVEGLRADDVLELDGRTISHARIGVATPADPGPHRVVGRRAGQEDARDVEVPEGGAAEVTIGGARPAPVAPPPPAVTTAPAVTMTPAAAFTPAEPRDESSDVSVALVVVGALLVGVGVALDNLPSSSQNTTFEALDLAPIALYGAGAVTVCFGVGWF